MVKKSPRTDKLKELILHVSLKRETDPTFGSTKLSKVLFYSDFTAFLYLGHSITGVPYQKLENGPAPRRLVPARREMEENGDIKIRLDRFYGYAQQKPIALRAPNLHDFTAEEIAVVDAVIEQTWGKTASEVSAQSHQFSGWRLVLCQP